MFGFFLLNLEIFLVIRFCVGGGGIGVMVVDSFLGLDVFKIIFLFMLILLESFFIRICFSKFEI